MKNEKKETAVDWLIQNHFGGIENCTPDFRHKIEQAKEMEKNQIKSIFCDGLICGIENPKVTPKQYYKQIWEGGEQ
jgi:hypothetical protein